MDEFTAANERAARLAPALDADLYLPALLDGFLGSRRWMAAAMGKATTDAKSAAARDKGKFGGRPKKTAYRNARQNQTDRAQR